jgi:hypothetical protein
MPDTPGMATETWDTPPAPAVMAGTGTEGMASVAMVTALGLTVKAKPEVAQWTGCPSCLPPQLG